MTQPSLFDPTPEDCRECQAGGGRFDFACVLCRVRYLARLPRKSMQVGWIERWRRQYGAEAASQTFDRLRGDR